VPGGFVYCFCCFKHATVKGPERQCGSFKKHPEEPKAGVAKKKFFRISRRGCKKGN
jgi:hypothetical protein